MSAPYINAIGYLAGALTTLSFLPQLLKTWRSRRAHDISYGWIALFSAGISLWLVYGLYLRSLPIITANAVTLSLVLIILRLKIAHR